MDGGNACCLGKRKAQIKDLKPRRCEAREWKRTTGSANTGWWRWMLKWEGPQERKYFCEFWDKDWGDRKRWRKKYKARKAPPKREVQFWYHLTEHWLTKGHRSTHWIWQGRRLFDKEGLLARGSKHLAADSRWSQMTSCQPGRGHNSSGPQRLMEFLSFLPSLLSVSVFLFFLPSFPTLPLSPPAFSFLWIVVWDSASTAGISPRS